MDLRDCIREAMCDLPDTEKMIVLSVMIDTLMDRVSELRKEVRFIRSIPISKIDPYQNHPFYVIDFSRTQKTDCNKCILTRDMY